MIKVAGTLSIRTISGRNGEFRVGRLISDIGEFSVKDAVLDQYDEGRYEGEFGISQIYPSHYSAAGRLVIEIRAVIGSIALSNIELKDQQEPAFESDPLDEENGNVLPKEKKAQVDKSSGNISSVSTAIEDEPRTASSTSDDELFGLLWPLGGQVKLDSTVDRIKLRQQRDRLGKLGYTFMPIGQFWVKQF